MKKCLLVAPKKTGKLNEVVYELKIIGKDPQAIVCKVEPSEKNTPCKNHQAFWHPVTLIK